MNIFKKTLNTPWKAFLQIRMYLIKPVVYLDALVKGVKIGVGGRFYGMPKFFMHRRSLISIGPRFEGRSSWDSNPLGINHPVIICTWKSKARVKIGSDVGMSGGSIVAASSVEIGSGTLIGANTTIIDTDFHPLNTSKRRYSSKNVKSLPIKIGKNVFIGMNSIILKGVNIPDGAVVPAGEVVRKNYKFK